MHFEEPISNLARNLDIILAKSGINATNFCDLCQSRGINVARSTISRITSSESNISLSTLHDIAAGVRLLIGFAHIDAAALIASPGDFPAGQAEQDEDFIRKFVDEFMFAAVTMGAVGTGRPDKEQLIKLARYCYLKEIRTP